MGPLPLPCGRQRLGGHARRGGEGHLHGPRRALRHQPLLHGEGAASHGQGPASARRVAPAGHPVVAPEGPGDASAV
eukprot:8358309-Alexandrium_andersonii.AAC.1